MCMLIALFSSRGVSSQAHELVLPFLMGTASSLSGSVGARCSRSRSRLNAPRCVPAPPASCRRARAKARLRSASARHSAVGCRCAPRPGAVPLGSGTTNQEPWFSASDPATTRNNSRLAARSRQPMQVRTGPSPRVGLSSCETTAEHSTGVAGSIRNGKGVGMVLVDDFDGPELDTDVWLPHYLPMWSSREATRASYRLESSCLVLDIPTDQGLWL